MKAKNDKKYGKSAKKTAVSGKKGGRKAAKGTRTPKAPRKYRLTNHRLSVDGDIVLHRIQALRDIGTVAKKGELGGWVESEENLSQSGDCWVGGDATVHGCAKVRDNAVVRGAAVVSDNAFVCENALVDGHAVIFNHAIVTDNARVCGWASIYDGAYVGGKAEVTDAIVCSYARIGGDAVVNDYRDFVVMKNFWSSGRYFTYTRSNGMWQVGCFHGTSKELLAKARLDGKLKYKCYKAAVRYVEAVYAKLAGKWKR